MNEKKLLVLINNSFVSCSLMIFPASDDLKRLAIGDCVID